MCKERNRSGAPEKGRGFLWASLNLQSAPLRSHLELAVRGEDADPSVVIVGHHNVAVHVHGDTCGSLQLSRGATSDPEPHLELAIVGKNLGWKEKERRNERERETLEWNLNPHCLVPRGRRCASSPVCTGCCCRPPPLCRCWRPRFPAGS